MARFAFFGTPEFAVPSLEALISLSELDHEIGLVVCQPDKPKGRGKKVLAPPVKERALEHNLLVTQPKTLKAGTEDGEAFFDLFQSLNIDLAVVAAYGRIIPNRLLKNPGSGFLNVHGSLLPRWRGAAPIQRAIQAGDTQTGVALMDMVFELDAGDVYTASAVNISDDDDALTLSAQLAQKGKTLLIDHIPQILAGNLPKTPQPPEGITYAAMLEKSESRLDWNLSARQLFNHIRAMYPWPGSLTYCEGAPLKLFSPYLVDESSIGQCGLIRHSSKELHVQTGQGIIGFREIQQQSRKKVRVEDFLRGHRFAKGAIFEDPPAKTT